MSRPIRAIGLFQSGGLGQAKFADQTVLGIVALEDAVAVAIETERDAMRGDHGLQGAKIRIKPDRNSLESVVRKLSFVWAHDRSVRSFSRLRRSPARLAIQHHKKVRSRYQRTLEYALLLVRFGLW
jgi:hypothetical protein